MGIDAVGVADDLSAYLIAGRVVSHVPDNIVDETAARTVAQGIGDGAEAERLGFANVYLSERWNLKEAGVVLGAVGARTSRVGLGTGLVSPAGRHVLHMAAFGATMMEASCGFGTAAQCARKLQEFKHAGVDEIATYGSTPGQNAGLLAAWRGDFAETSR